jgi:hypothetical protein
MLFIDAPGSLKDKGLRRVKSGKVGRPSRVVGQSGFHHCVAASEKVTRLFEIGAGLLLHRSMPSARIAYINGMRGSL